VSLSGALAAEPVLRETRQGDHRPQLSDLRESGSDRAGWPMSWASSFAGGLSAGSRKILKGLAELILAKQRNGPIGKIDLVFLHAQTRLRTGRKIWAICLPRIGNICQGLCLSVMARLFSSSRSPL